MAATNVRRVRLRAGKCRAAARYCGVGDDRSLWNDRAVIDDPDTEAVRSTVAAMLPASVRPWSIRVRRNEHDVGWVIDFSHEASSGFGLMVRFADVDEAIASATRGLAHNESELRRVAAAPLLTNPDAFMEVRGLASIFNWSRLEVRAVVSMMQRWVPWSTDEVGWFRTWIGHDGDIPAPSSDF